MRESEREPVRSLRPAASRPKQQLETGRRLKPRRRSRFVISGSETRPGDQPTLWPGAVVSLAFKMTVLRMGNVGIVVDDLGAETAFFVELGLKLLGDAMVEGDWVDRVVGLTESARRSRCWRLWTATAGSN